MQAKIQLSDHFTYGRLLRFVLPSAVMFIVMSIYSVVDGLFVSNFVGQTEFASLNFIFPVIMIIATPGFMLGTGGSAIVSKTLGEGDREKANRLFSLFCFLAIGIGVVLAAAAFILIPPIATLMGASEEMLPFCTLYGRIMTIGSIPQTLHFVFEAFNVTAEKPELGLKITIASGITNIVLDALFIIVFKWGLAGAALASVLSMCIGGFVPFIYYICPNSSLLRITKTRFDGKAFLKACTNGSSELMSNISMSLVGMLYNIQLMKYFDEPGVSAYGIMMYVNMIFVGAFIGYSVGTAPIIGFHFGEGDKKELHNILVKSIVILAIGGVLMLGAGELCARPLAAFYCSDDEALLELTVSGFRIYSITFLLCGFAIFASSFFTALSDGLTSALISFLRTLVFESASVMILPLLLDGDGIWWSAVLAEGMAIILSAIFLIIKRKKFGY